MTFQRQEKILVKTIPMFKIVCSVTNPAQLSNENNTLHIHISACPYSPWEIKKGSANRQVQNILMEYIAVTNFKIYLVEPEKTYFTLYLIRYMFSIC